MTSAPKALLERLAPNGGGAAGGASSWLEAHGLPTTKAEAWRYTPVDEIVAGLEAAVPAAASHVTLHQVDELAGDHGGPRLVLVNGRPVPELSRLDGLPTGLRLDGEGTAAEAPPHPDDVVRYDGFQALNELASPGLAVLDVAAGTELHLPVHLVHVTVPGQSSVVSQPRTLIRLGEGSRATVIETYAGLPGATITNASTTVQLAPSASLVHHRVQVDAPEALHVGHTRVEQAADSHLRSMSVMLGAAIARHALDLTLQGEHARAELDGLYLISGHQRHDNVVTVDHAASHGTTDQHFRGVMADQARGSFSGHVIVRAGTVRTDANQSNRNLLLSRAAQADTRPWLEIFADDVRCNHGATVGRLDDDALFYLQSRGIPEADARTILIGAFVNEITDTIEPLSLRDHLTDVIALRMGAQP